MSKVSLAGNASGTGIFTIASPNSNIDRTLTLPDNTGTLLTSGNPISGTTGTFTGLLDISAAGAGQIRFPATANISANANTLDDYEEGTWTPFFTSDGGTTGTTTVTARWGRYVKIGQQVTVTFGWSGTLSGYTGTLYVGGTPFLAIDDTTYQFGGGFNCAANTATSSNGSNFVFFAFSNALYPWFTTGQSSGYLFTGGTSINGLTSMQGSMTYLTAS